MLTAWGKKIILGNTPATSGVIAPNIQVAMPANITAKTCAGNDVYTNAKLSSYTANLLTSALIESGTSASTGFAIGSGDTAPTENDYSLVAQITGVSGSMSGGETIYDADSGKYISRIDFTISNNTENSVVVKEIARFVQVSSATAIGQNTSSAAGNKRCVMLDRTVLDEPVTIPANNAGVVRYEFIY